MNVVFLSPSGDGGGVGLHRVDGQVFGEDNDPSVPLPCNLVRLPQNIGRRGMLSGRSAATSKEIRLLVATSQRCSGLSGMNVSDGGAPFARPHLHARAEVA